MDGVEVYVIECDQVRFVIVFFFFNDTATTEIYTSLFVGSVRCVRDSRKAQPLRLGRGARIT